MTDQPSVLVIDDEPGLREMLAFELSMEGFAVEAVDSGSAAIEALRRRRFDVAITDLKMPGMDGVQTLEALRLADPEIEIIVATGHATVETAVACMKRGAFDYIQKPYDLLEVKALLDRAMERSHLSSVVALYEASRAILSTLKPAELVALVLGLARRILRADAALLVAEGADGAREPIHGLSSDEASLEGPLRELAGRADASGAPILARGADGTSGLAYPLTARDRRIGCLVAARRADSPAFVASELRKGTVFANQIALALDNANLHEELGRRVEELVRTREELVQAEKLTMAGQLAQSIAHEINNPLSLMRVNLDALGEMVADVAALGEAARGAAGFLRALPDREAAAVADELMSSRLADDAFARDFSDLLDETLGSVKRITELMSGFRQMGAEPAGQPRPGPVDLGGMLRRCLAASPAAGAIDLDAATGVALASAVDLETALINLLGYLAGPASERAGGGRIAVRVGDAGDPRRVRLVVTHDRLSLSADDVRRLFDPRLEVNTSRGRVLRLSIELALAYRLLVRGGARVAVRGVEPRGVRFEIDLPRAGA